MNLGEKLIEIRKCAPYLKKENTGTQYKYVGSSQVLAAVKSKMDELGVLLIPEIRDAKVTEKAEQKIDDKGNPKTTITYFTELFMTMTWMDASKPEDKISVPWYGQGVDIAGEKGVGKALTYAEKYFMLKFFNIPTDKDDPDAFQQKHAPEKEIDPDAIYLEIKSAFAGAYTTGDVKKVNAVGVKYKNAFPVLTEEQQKELKGEFKKIMNELTKQEAS